MIQQTKRRGRPRTLPDLVCEQCGTHFRPYTSGSRFCSKKCFGAWHSAKGTYKAVRDEKVCPACDKTFLVGGAGSRRTQKLCSLECAQKQKSPPARRMSATERAWLAGLFDGEGSIVMPDKRQVNSVRMSVSNTNYPLLERVLEVTGTGAIIHQRAATDKHAQCWYWQCYADNARSLLRQMLPWLIVKRERAEAAIASVSRPPGRPPKQ